MIDPRVGRLAAEMGLMCSVTRQHDWAEGLPCKIIGTGDYLKALTIATLMATEIPGLEMPVPGADPEGWLWLTWTQGDSKGLALELRPGKYRWTQNNMGDKRTFESDSLNDLVEAMRTVFPKRVV